jgi:hypothetical protein
MKNPRYFDFFCRATTKEWLGMIPEGVWCTISNTHLTLKETNVGQLFRNYTKPLVGYHGSA